MRILSLNVNDFGGRDNLKKNKHRYGMKEAYSRWDRLPRRENAEAVLAFIEKKGPQFLKGRKTSFPHPSVRPAGPLLSGTAHSP